MESVKGAGGTSGGIGMFFTGVILLGLGLYLFMSRILVISNLFTIVGFNPLGICLVTFVAGLGFLFFNAKSIAGWILSVGSVVLVLATVITNLTFFFMPTNLFVTLCMLALIGAGLGLVARSFRPRPQ